MSRSAQEAREAGRRQAESLHLARVIALTALVAQVLHYALAISGRALLSLPFTP